MLSTGRSSSRWLAGAIIAAGAAAACVGEIEAPGSSAGGTPSTGVKTAAAEAARAGLRRLTAAEYDATVRDLLGVVEVSSATVLPEDHRAPFDNDYTLQNASEALINSADSLAGELAAEVVSKPELRSKVVPCSPAGATDAGCFQSFVESFGRRALRRPLSAEEVARFVQLLSHATEEGDFWVAVESALRAFLQHPALLYRPEVGTPVAGKPGVARLNAYETAARLSYLLWGTTPPDSLLDAARDGKLATRDGVRSVASAMLDDERARGQLARFHSLWLGYEKLPHSPSLSAAMARETRALLDRVIFDERRPWLGVLESRETFVSDELAAHYGLAAPKNPDGAWVEYGTAPRQGLLSHGTFLSAAGKFDDTSPTQRGLLIRARLLCEEIGPPPPTLKVNVDEPPEAADPNACKSERYSMWRTDGCSMCHSKLEPVGFGLENFDSAGRFRTHEPNRPDCEITGLGEVEGVGAFSGPVELSARLIEAGGIETCVASYYLRFALGRYDLDERDEAFVSRVMQGFAPGKMQLREVILELVSQETFRLRREEEAP